MNVKHTALSQWPIPEISMEAQKPITEKVDEIIAQKKKNSSANTIHLEKQIDQMVYELYALSENEIEIIESV